MKTLVLTLAVLFHLTGGLALAEDGSSTFVEEQLVTAVDVVVEVGRQRSKSLVERLPPYLISDDFEVIYDGRERQVLSVGAFGPAQHSADNEPWTFVLYFDRRLSGPAEISWAAARLIEYVERLSSLGEVEIVIADPDPNTILQSTRSAEQVGAVLAEIALFPEGDDHEILKLRDEFLLEVHRADSEIDPAELADFAVNEEQGLVQYQLDTLITWIAAAEGGARRAIFFACEGFDLRPREFYQAHASGNRGGGGKPPVSSLGEDLGALERTLAAYGWVMFPVLTPPEEKASGGFRIGKWRLGKGQGELRESSIDPTSPHDKVQPVLLNFFKLTREKSRDPEKARAYRELADTLVKQEDWPEAEQAFRMTLHHFAGDPATGLEQGQVLEKLAGTLERQGRRREARGAYAKALELNPGAAIKFAGQLAELSHASVPLERLARSTTGNLIRSGEDLADALSGLAHRVRLTFQVTGAASGLLYPLEVGCRRRGCELRAPGWARSGTPEEVATARLRRWLGDDQFEGDMKITARLAPEVARIEMELEAEGGPGGSPPSLRLTLGFGDPDKIIAVRHSRQRPEKKSDPARWLLTTDFMASLLPSSGRRGVAILVEDLASGRWGATVVEIPPEARF